MKRIKLGLGFIGIIVFCVAISGCSDSSGPTNQIRIGANFEMTGDNATMGLSAANGAKLAIKEVNAKGGINGKTVTLNLADNKSNAAEAANVAQKLIVQDKVHALLAPVSTPALIAAAAVSEEYKVPAVVIASSNQKATFDPAAKKVRSFLFRTAMIAEHQGMVAATFAAQSLKVKTAALYIDKNSEYSQAAARNFEETFVKKGGNIVSRETYTVNDTDFKAAITRIKNSGAQVVFVPGEYQETGIIVRQSREMSLTVPILGGEGWNSVKLQEIGTTKALNNTYFVSHFSADDKSSQVAAFIKNYQAEYQSTPDKYAALAFDSVMLIVDAMRRAGSEDPIKVRDELSKTKNASAVTGQISMNDRHDALRSAVIIEMKDGKQLFREKFNP
jgi:branched-chain amino acid transport system substrate-binding protein